MKPFDLKEAKKGAKLVTRHGRSVRLICFDRITGGKVAPVIGLMKNKDGTYEHLVFYNLQGQNADGITDYDLLIND
jgi:hypothetical protein